MSEVSVVEVRSGLFLGTRQHALCARLVSSLRLSHILTLGIEPLEPADLPSSIPPWQASGGRPTETQEQDEDQEHLGSNQLDKSEKSTGRSPDQNLKKMVKGAKYRQKPVAEHSVARSKVPSVSRSFSSDIASCDLPVSLHVKPQTKRDDSAKERWELCCNFTEPLVVVDFDTNTLVDERQLQKLQIDAKETSVASCPPQAFYFLLDEEGADLLGVLPGALDYIDQALASDGRILVHCESGVSRAPAVIAAWLMFSENLSLPTALQHLRMLRPDVEPNAGFISQLKVVESTGCKFQLSLPIIRQHRLQTLVPRGSTPKELPQGCFAEDPATTTTEGLYRCRRCRRILFKASSLISHLPGSGNFASNKRHVPLAVDTTPSLVAEPPLCSSWFVEPLAWMETSLLGVTQGQLSCPKCRVKLGSFSWCGLQCSCSAWVTPAFCLHRARLDPPKDRGTIPQSVCS